jgi:FAD/FMN-containing dehydrogenase
LWQILYATENGKPFLAISGQHGATTALAQVKSGVGIWMRNMTHIKLGDDGKTVISGGGVVTKQFLDFIWGHGKEAGLCASPVEIRRSRKLTVV